MIRRVNFYAGPGAGKSTIAARTFAELKIRGHEVEHIPEYIKTWAHEGRVPQSYDQLYVFAKQVKSEDIILRNVPLIVTDSPVLLSTSYAKHQSVPFYEYLVRVAQQFDRDFPPLNLFIERTVDYNGAGRYQNEREAHDFDKYLLEFLGENLIGELHHVKVEEFDQIIEMIEGAISGGNS